MKPLGPDEGMNALRHPDCRFCDEYQRLLRGVALERDQAKEKLAKLEDATSTQQSVSSPDPDTCERCGHGRSEHGPFRNSATAFCGVQTCRCFDFKAFGNNQPDPDTGEAGEAKLWRSGTVADRCQHCGGGMDELGCVHRRSPQCLRSEPTAPESATGYRLTRDDGERLGSIATLIESAIDSRDDRITRDVRYLRKLSAASLSGKEQGGEFTAAAKVFADSVERDRREPDKLLCHLQTFRRALAACSEQGGEGDRG